MEAIGAVASVLQVAQFGTQLSITLYHVASTIGSATKDVRYIAKDIALFSAVLKDLSKALEIGQKARLFRKDAFDTSIKIVDECNGVFTEIEGVLKKISKNGDPLQNQFELPRLEKVLWFFRKSRIDFLRGVLESLKSTILVELAVLNYATKVTSPLTDDKIDVDELLALKSLVLANETATSDLQELTNAEDATEDPPGPIAVSGVSLYRNSSNVKPVGLLQTSNVATDSVHASSRFASIRQEIKNGSKDPETQDNTRSSSSYWTSRYWTQIDRLELAIQQFNLAKWEHERIEENVALKVQADANDAPALVKEDFLLSRLKADMTKFGLREPLVDRAMNILRSPGPLSARKVEVNQMMPKSESTIADLKSVGVPWMVDEKYPNCLVVRRWLPDLFCDVLWEHTRGFLEASIPSEGQSQPEPLCSKFNSKKDTSIALSGMKESPIPNTTSELPESGPVPLSKIQELAGTSKVSKLDFEDMASKMLPARSGKRRHLSQEPHLSPMLLDSDQDSDFDEGQPIVEDGQIDLVLSAPRDENTGPMHLSHEATRRAQGWGLHGFDECSWIPSLRDMEQHRKLQEQHNKIEDWLDKETHNVDIDKVDSTDTSPPPQIQRMPVNRGIKRRRSNSLGLSQTSEDHPLGSGSDITENSEPTSTKSQTKSQGSRFQSQLPPLPGSANAAIMEFRSSAENIETASHAATAGSRREFDFASYKEKRQKGTEGRERYFRQDRDSVLRAVDELIKRWTYLDAPPPTVDVGTEEYTLISDV